MNLKLITSFAIVRTLISIISPNQYSIKKYSAKYLITLQKSNTKTIQLQKDHSKTTPQNDSNMAFIIKILT